MFENKTFYQLIGNFLGLTAPASLARKRKTEKFTVGSIYPFGTLTVTIDLSQVTFPAL